MRREERKSKEPKKQPKESSVFTLEQKKQKLREEIKDSFWRAFGHEDSAPIPNQRSK